MNQPELRQFKYLPCCVKGRLFAQNLETLKAQISEKTNGTTLLEFLNHLSRYRTHPAFSHAILQELIADESRSFGLTYALSEPEAKSLQQNTTFMHALEHAIVQHGINDTGGLISRLSQPDAQPLRENEAFMHFIKQTIIKNGVKDAQCIVEILSRPTTKTLRDNKLFIPFLTKISVKSDNNDLYSCISYLSQVLSDHPHLAMKLNNPTWMDCFADIIINEATDVAVEYVNKSASTHSSAFFTPASGSRNSVHQVADECTHAYRSANTRQQ